MDYEEFVYEIREVVEFAIQVESSGTATMSQFTLDYVDRKIEDFWNKLA